LKKFLTGNIPQTILQPTKITSYEIALAELGWNLCKEHFNIELYFTQALIFAQIINPNIDLMTIITASRYGKSFLISLALIYLAAINRLKINIGGGDKGKAGIIMDNVSRNLPKGNEMITASLYGKDKLQSLSTSLNKQFIQWWDGGSIDIFTLSERLKEAEIEGAGAIGLGGDVIVIDESPLVSDANYSVARRMIVESKAGKFIELGNPLLRNHFHTATLDPDYYHIHANAQTAIEEGRFDADRVAKAKKGMTTKQIKIYIDALFPEKNEYTYFKPSAYKTLPPVEELEFYGALDPALGEALRGSKSGVIVIAVHKETREVYEVESIIEKLTPEEAMNKIFSLPYKFERFYVEAIQFQRYFFNTMNEKSRQLGKYIPFEAITQAKDKRERIESMEPFINTAIIRFKGGNQLWDDLGTYPSTEYLDGMDALQMVLSRVVGGAWSPAA
jgi:predicted phage terminase large subunit-like protein